MKIAKLFCVVLVLTVAVTAPLAAFEKGTKGVGGTFHFGGVKHGKGTHTDYSLRFNPEGTYFVIDNLCIDLSLSMGVNWNKDTPVLPFYGIGIGGRYFIKRFYGGFSLFWNRYKTEYYLNIYSSYWDPNIPQTGTQWGSYANLVLKAGHLFPIAKNIYLDAGVGYLMGLGEYAFSKQTNLDNNVNQFRTKLGLAIFF